MKKLPLFNIKGDKGDPGIFLDSNGKVPEVTIPDRLSVDQLRAAINAQIFAYLQQNPAASPEAIATAVEAYLVANPTAHTHEIGDVTGLEDALANAGGGVSTGWQDVSHLLITSAASGDAYVMREGNRVTWRFQITPASTALSGLIPVPAGFEDDGPLANVAHPVPGLSNIYAGRISQAGGQIWIQAGTGALRFQYEYNPTAPMPQ